MKLSPQLTQSKKVGSANKLFATVFWVLVLGAGSNWLGSVAKTVGDDRVLPGTTASPRVERLRSNLMKFNRQVAGSDLIDNVMPMGNSKANELSIQLAPTWNRESSRDQDRALADVADLWSKTVNANPAASTKPRVWFRRGDGELVKVLS